MIIDSELEFSEAQDLSQVANTYVSTNIVDFTATNDMGPGTPVPIEIRIDEAFTSGGAATLQVQVQTATDAAFSTPVVLAETDEMALATLTLGRSIPLTVLPNECLRFLRIAYIIGTATTTAGTCSAFIPASKDQPHKAA